MSFCLRAGADAFSGQVGIAGNDGAEAASSSIADGETFVHEKALRDELVEIWRVAGVGTHRADIMPAKAFKDNQNDIVIMAGQTRIGYSAERIDRRAAQGVAGAAI